MVNISIVSRYSEPPLPSGGKTGRDIRGPQDEPLYPAHEVLKLLSNNVDKTINPWSQKCIKDIQKWSLEDQLPGLLELALQHDRFRGAEWCAQKPNGPWAACDVYLINRDELIEASNISINMKYYIKFAIAVTGKILILASCHPEEDRG